MPSNIKSWDNLKRADYDLLIQDLRSRGAATPYSDSGLLRLAGTLADVGFEEKEGTLNVRIRTVGRGETYSSVFGKIDTIIHSTSR